MTSYSRALRFIGAQQAGLKPAAVQAISRRLTTMNAGKKALHTEIYRPTNCAAVPVIFLHGMSPLGIADPRQVKAARALAHAGFCVICPELPEIRNLRITAAAIDDFAALVSAVLADTSLAPAGRVALFAPSFSGAICLRVAALPTLARSIAVVCAIGSLAGIRNSMEYLFLSDAADTYARNIVLANYLPLVKKYAALSRVFLELAHDNWNASASENPDLPGFQKTNHAFASMRKLKPALRKIAEALSLDAAYRAQVFAELNKHMEREIDAYDVLSVAQNITCPVLLLHGATDNVIPPSESVELAKHLPNCRLVVSPFVGHGDSRVSLRRIPDVIRLIGGFAWFFRRVAA